MTCIELDQEQCRKVTVKHIADTLMSKKQYLNESKITRYRFMLYEFASVVEICDIAERFNNTWPRDITFY